MVARLQPGRSRRAGGTTASPGWSCPSRRTTGEGLVRLALAAVLAAAIALSSLCLILSQVWLEISHPILAIFSWYTLVFLAGQAVQFPVNVAARSFDLAAHVRRIGAWQPASYPDVDIYLPVCGEPMAVLRNTWTGVFELVHAYPGCARAYVLDDGPSDEARDVSGAFGFSTCDGRRAASQERPATSITRSAGRRARCW